MPSMKIRLALTIAILIIIICLKYFNAINFSINFATILLVLLCVASFAFGVGAVVPKLGRTGLSKKMIGIGFFILAILSTITFN